MQIAGHTVMKMRMERYGHVRWELSLAATVEGCGEGSGLVSSGSRYRRRVYAVMPSAVTIEDHETPALW